MKFQQILKVSSATAVLGLALASQPAFAQVEPVDETTTTATDEDAIIVTGSLIRNPNLERSAPVNVTTEAEIELKQATNAENLLREVPGLVPNIGSNTNNGNNGTARVDLRGLGSNRNIVMLNSTRITPSDTFGVVDLNNIPVALIERVDVLTGGASTTYGADAVTGVVNFITKRDFGGMDLQLTSGITERGDTANIRGDLVLGANFDDGRGNAVISVGYMQADPLYFSERDLGQCVVNSNTGFCGGDSPTSTPSSFGVATGNLQVSPDGQSLVPQYALFNFNPFNIYSVPYERYNTYGEAHYDVSDRVTVYARGLFSKNTVDSIVAPSGVFGDPLTIPGQNPFLTPGIRNQLCTLAGIALGPTCDTNAAIPLAAPYRRTVEVGPRIDSYVTNIFDVKVGTTVNLFANVDFDVYAAYGESENVRSRLNYVSRTRVQQALNATSATACTNTANGCVPLNFFGQPGSITPQMAAFIGGVTSRIQQFASLSQVHGQIGGDFGYNLPWASEPIGFAIGAEQREYVAAQNPDNLAAVPGELGGAGGAVTQYKGAYRARDAFAELVLPIASDRPFFNELTLEAGIRHSWYDIEAPGNPSFDATTWKVGGTFSPVRELTFRANYTQAVRAPNIFELFRPFSTQLTNLATDPCAGAAPTTNANLRAVCIAQGAPATAIGSILDPAAGQANVTVGGSTALRPETARTFTVGVLVQPASFLPGFNLSLDYYRINVTDAINAALPGDLIAACFGSLSAASATNPDCTSIRRNPTTGRLSGSVVNTPGLYAPLSNAGRLFTDGFDLIANYRTDLGFADLSLNFAGNYTDRSFFDASQASTTNVFPNCPGVYSANCGIAVGGLQPEWSWSLRTTLGFEGIDLSLLWRHISSFDYEFGTLCGPNATLRNAACTGQIRGSGPFVGQTVDLNHIPSYDYFDLTARFKVAENFSLIGTVYNLLDKDPPLLGGQAGTTTANSGNTFPSTYDVLGRRYSVTARLTF